MATPRRTSPLYVYVFGFTCAVFQLYSWNSGNARQIGPRTYTYTCQKKSQFLHFYRNRRFRRQTRIFKMADVHPSFVRFGISQFRQTQRSLAVLYIPQNVEHGVRNTENVNVCYGCTYADRFRRTFPEFQLYSWNTGYVKP